MFVYSRDYSDFAIWDGSDMYIYIMIGKEK